MRKLVFILIGIFFTIKITANPIWVPEVCLCRFWFNANQEWLINLCYYGRLDSVKISSSTGKSICKNMVWYESISSDSLSSPVNFNPDGDSVSIISYFQGDSIQEEFVYGNYRNSFIPKLKKGQSIERVVLESEDKNYYSICDSLGNNQGTLHGHIYNKNDSLITTGSFVVDPIPSFSENCMAVSAVDNGFTVKDDGIYSTKVYSLLYNIDSIGVCGVLNCWNGNFYRQVGTLRINPMIFTMEPDSSVEMDIHLLNEYVNVKTIKNNANQFLKVFPNPIENISFNYEIYVPVKSTQCVIDLIDIAGKEIKRYKVNENKGELQLPSNILSGVYLLKLLLNDKVYFSVPIIVNKK